MTTTTTSMRQHEDATKAAQQSAASFGDKAKSFAEQAADKAKEAASSVGDTAEHATHAVGSGMESLGETLRENLPQKGVLGAATSSVAGCLESSGHYIKEEGLHGMADDVTNMIRRNPIPALLIAAALGYFVARATSRS